MEKSPLVTIVIVSFNTKKLLLSCLSSIEKWVSVRYEIIIVDNNSSDGSPEAILKLSKKHIHLIKNKENAGFSKANNQGFVKARGKYVLMLNSDTYLTEDCISPAIEKLENNTKIGVISCRLQNANGTLQPTGGYFPTLFRLFCWMGFIDDVLSYGPFSHAVHPKPSFYTKSRELDWVTGAFFMFPRAILEKVSGLDEDYFMYVEELDFCYRVKKLGYTVFYLHNTSVVHLGRASSTNEFAIESEFKNILLFYRKHFPQFLGIARFLEKAGCMLRVMLFAILGKETEKKIYEKTLAIL